MALFSRTITLFSTIVFALFLFQAFGQKSFDMQAIVDRCIKVHGGEKIKNGAFSFDFRKYGFTFQMDKGKYVYSRMHKETGVKDILTNDSVKRFIDEREITLSEKDKKRYGSSLNSVIYFAFLPYFLNDVSVHKELIGEVTLKGKDYYKLRVTFSEEGGGDDFEDQYIYWINKRTFTMDYLAYSYHINGGGVRFREAYNARQVEGVRFQDYVNYKHDKNTPVETLDDLFKRGELKELSKIVLENVGIIK